jgi:hypothetical protein
MPGREAMTLLIGTISNEHLLLTSDRRCTVDEQGIVSHVDDFQKIFPVPGRPLAIAHYGENAFVGENGLTVPLSLYLDAFMAENGDCFDQSSVDSVTHFLVERLEPTVVRTLKNRGKLLVGFWVAGFVKGKANPEIHEVCWLKNGRREVKKQGILVVGGDGQEHLPPNVRERLDGSYSVGKIPKASVERTRRYHNKLFDIALKKEPEPRRFSDQKDQLSIDKHGCHWIIAPAKATTAACE